MTGTMRKDWQVRADAAARDEDKRMDLQLHRRTGELAGPSPDAQALAKAFLKTTAAHPTWAEASARVSGGMGRAESELDGSAARQHCARAVLLNLRDIDDESNAPGTVRLLQKCECWDAKLQKMWDESGRSDEGEGDTVIAKADATGKTPWKILRVYVATYTGTDSGLSLVSDPWAKYRALRAWRQGASLAGHSVEALGDFKVSAGRVDWTGFDQACVSRGLVAPESLVQ